MNPRELIARLNVPAVRYEMGRGGIPELTNVDIAGVLGMIGDKEDDNGKLISDPDMVFAREVFAALWWPDGAHLSRTELSHAVLNRVMDEFARRQRLATVAKLELNIAECGLAGKRHVTEFDRKILRECTEAVERARRMCWPWDATVYVRLYDAVTHEIRNPRHCPACHGRGEMFRGDLKVKCPECIGTGVKDQKKNKRATMIHVADDAYLRSWFKVYNWTYGLIRDADLRAAIQFAKAISTPETEVV